MLYTFQLAWRRIMRSKAKTLLSAFQLGMALTLFVTVLTIYLGVEHSIRMYKHAFGSDLYNINVHGRATSESGRQPFQFSSELMTQLQSVDKIKVYIGSFEAGQDGKTILLLSEELYKTVVSDKGIQWDLLSRLGYRYLSESTEVTSLPPNHSSSVTYAWIQGEVNPETKRTLLQILGQHGGDLYFHLENVLGASQESLNTAKGLSLVFLIFTISIMVCFAIGHLGAVLLDYLRNKSNWAIHLLLGASRTHIILSYNLQFMMMSLPILLCSTILSSFVVYYYEPDYVQQLPWTVLAALLVLTCMTLLSVLPFFKFKNTPLISHLS
ncbi:ABC transporter permease [Paenibacillus sp. JSM ZJ436]|uniref:ABC transporter permease n=1 Tax=Paenibacillus sp. JSM ZJ436 TaxID=3376190 RepID=UPI003798F6CA